MKYETVKAKADKLLKLSDSLGSNSTAEGRRLARLCGHYRRLQKKLKEKGKRDAAPA